MIVKFLTPSCALLGFSVLGVACSQVDSGSCSMPEASTAWFHIYETNGIMSQSKCVLCDTSVAEADWVDWVLDNASADGIPSSLSEGSATPCLYVYGSASDSEAACAAAVCSGSPEINDPVLQGHGTWSDIRDRLPNASSDAAAGDRAVLEGAELGDSGAPEFGGAL